MAKYLGRLINFLSGIQGVAAGGQAVVNLPLNQRIHGIDLQCTALNYTGGVAIVPTIVTAAGFTNTTGTCLLNVTNGQITSVTYAAGNSAGASTSTVLSVKDPTGKPCLLTCTVAGTGALGNATFTITQYAGPIDPGTLITGVKLTVNGQNMQDITPAQIKAIAAACGYLDQFGTLSLNFTEPARNFLRDNELTSWDLNGQVQCSLQLTISPNVVIPGIKGVIHYDYNRNMHKASATTAKALGVAVGAQVPFLQPVSKHAFSQNIIAGKNDITTIPWSFPISRLWFVGSTPGGLYQLEILADGTKILEADAQQIYAAYSKYGFQIGNPYVASATAGGYGSAAGVANSVAGSPAGGNLAAMTIPNGALLVTGTAGNQGCVAANGVFPFDLAFIADMDGRPWEALKVAQSLIIRVYSDTAQVLTTIVESLPGGYQS